jgi:hypothetical protein
MAIRSLFNELTHQIHIICDKDLARAVDYSITSGQGRVHRKGKITPAFFEQYISTKALPEGAYSFRAGDVVLNFEK